MASSPTPKVFCVITTDKERVMPGGAPVLIAKDEEEQGRLAMWICRITDAIVHDLHNGVWLLVVNLPGPG